MVLALLLSAHALAVPAPLAELEERARAPVEPRVAIEAAPVVIREAVVLTAAGERFEPGHVVLQGGGISAVGAGPPPDVPDDAVVVDADGRFVTPGLIDTHSHLGVFPSPRDRAHADGNESTSPTTPGVRAEDSIWPFDPGFERAVAGGVTALHVLPGSANLVGGRGVTIRPIPARGARAMRLEGAPDTVKMACGENPKRVYGSRNSAPSTRMGNLRGKRNALLAAQRSLEAWKTYAEERAAYEEALAEREALPPRRRGRVEVPSEPDPPRRNLDRETLVGVLAGSVLAQVHCYRSDDMLAMLQVADEFDFPVRTFHHALEAYKIRDILAERGVAVATWADWWGFKLEAYDAIPHGPALLADEGARAVIHSDSAIEIQRLNQAAAKAYYTGVHAGLELDEDQALRWVTANAAWAIGVDDQLGTLEVGKRGDVVLWDRHPFSTYARAEQVYIDGALRFDREGGGGPWSDFEVGQEVGR